ncbi:MAG: PIG-L family deacetylase, partial [Candidatus Berkelbacteria bacterium]|nr:PIG-L family deacetylase [Candidatus Berkelbacteria bacterium]
MSLIKFKNRLLDLNFLRKALGFSFLAKKYSAGLRLKISDKTKSGRVLILAPHPDDEVFGCGGAIIKHVSVRDPIKIVYLTDCKNIFRTRRKEAKKAAKIMGVKDLEFLSYKDGELVAGQKETKEISAIILKFKPDIIYAPYFFDSHPDHQATAEILWQAIKKIKFDGAIWSYEIWTPLLCNRIIKIDNIFGQKVQAIKAYKSQLQDRGYLRAIKGINSYRAGMFGKGNYSEAYFAVRAG